jgi:predicted enzyme related to lactoylglutathione lyase
MIILEGFDYLAITVKELERSRQFYTEMFDFEVVREFETEDAVVLEFEGTRIKLIQDSEFEGADGQNSAFFAFAMDVDDFTDALESLESNGIDLVAGPMAEEGGEALYIADPDGYRIKLAYRE